MALNKDKDLKKYFSISEVATQFGVAESVLRFWEKEFPNIKPRKTQRNVRQYTREDIEEVRTVYTLLKVRGMKIGSRQGDAVQEQEGCHRHDCGAQQAGVHQGRIAGYQPRAGGTVRDWKAHPPAGEPAQEENLPASKGKRKTLREDFPHTFSIHEKHTSAQPDCTAALP